MHQTPRAEPLRAVDANVLLRYLLTDVPDQAERARLLVDSDQPLGLTAVALAEIAWTLAGPHYRYPRPGRYAARALARSPEHRGHRVQQGGGAGSVAGLRSPDRRTTPR